MRHQRSREKQQDIAMEHGPMQGHEMLERTIKPGAAIAVGRSRGGSAHGLPGCRVTMLDAFAA